MTDQPPASTVLASLSTPRSVGVQGEPTPLPTPARAGAYELGRFLGRGSFGTVHETTDPETGERLALKLLHNADPWALEAFKNEARLLADVHHPSLITPDEVLEFDGRIALVMRFVDGRGFVDAAAEAAGPAGRLHDRERFARLAWALVQAVQALHAAGFVHMDLKPGNVRVTPDDKVVLLDFGFTRRPAQDAEVEHDVVGTPRYMSPEQLAGAAPAPAFDWYAVGVMLHEALTSTEPFHGVGDPVFSRVLGTPPSVAERRPGLEVGWVTVCDQLLARDPADRATGLLALAAELDQPAEDLTRSPRVEPPFVGRHAELERLKRLWAGVVEGAPALVTVTGPHGIGKSELARRLAHELGRDAELLTVFGRCSAREAIPYRALDAAADALCAHVRRDPELRAALRHDPDLGTLQRVFPVFRTLDGPELAPAAPDLPLRLREALKSVARCLSVDAPMLLVIDDAHDGDLDSVDPLLHLLSPPHAPRLMVVLTCRADAWATSPFGSALRERLARGAPFTVDEVPLRPLDPSSASELVGIRLGRARDPAAVDRIVTVAGGSPLLLSLADEALGDGVEVTTLLRARLQARSPELQAFVRHAALAGGTVDLAVAAAAAGAPIPDRLVLSELAADRLVRPVGSVGRRRVESDHALVAHAVLEGWSDDERAAAHRRLAVALAERGGDAGAVAAHWLAGGDLDAARDWALRGARAASAASAFGRAAELLDLAVQTSAGLSPRARRDLRQELAEAQHGAGLGARAAQTWLTLAADEPDAAARRALLRRAADARLLGGDVAGGLQIAAPLLTELRAPPLVDGPRAIARVLGGLLWVWRRGRGLAAAPVPDPAAAERCDTLWTVAKGLVFVDPVRGLGFLLASLREAARSGDAVRVGRSMGPLAGFLLGQLPGFRTIAGAWLERLGSMAGPARPPYLAAAADLWRSLAAQAEGDYATAEDLGRRAELGFRHLPEATWEGVQAASLVARVLRSRGELLACTTMVQQYLRDAERRGDLYGRMLFGDYDVLGTLARDAVDEARTRVAWLREHWLPGQYTVQTAYAEIQEATIDLYVGRAVAAAERLVADRPAFRRAGGYRFVFARIERNVLEGRIALACGDRAPRGSWTVDAILRALDRETLAEAAGYAALLRASQAARAGRRDDALASLEVAVSRLEAARFPLDATVARVRRAELLGDATAAAAEHAALRRLGVRNPDRWVAMAAPGFEALSAR